MRRTVALLPWLLLACDPVLPTGKEVRAPEAPPDDDCGGQPCYTRIAAPRPVAAGLPGENVQFLAFPTSRPGSNARWGGLLTDIWQHLPPSYGDQYWFENEHITAGHETTHGINSDLRNNHNDTGKRANGFYVLGDRGVIVVEPNIRKSAANRYVPQALRGSRFDLYMNGQTAWDDTPTYIFDEWTSYINGAMVGVEQVERGIYGGQWTDAVYGPLEFTVYGLAVAMAAEQGDPAFFAANAQFKEFVAFSIRRSMEVYRKGARMNEFKWDVQDRYYTELTTGTAGASFRDFVRRVYGDRFLGEVLLGQPPTGTGGAGGAGGAGAGGAGAGGAGAGGAGAGGAGAGGAGGSGAGGSGGGNGGGNGTGNGTGPIGDSDGDGVRNADDLCRDSMRGAPVWTYGEWSGCAEGQYRDRLAPTPGTDADGDGVPDAQDLCSNTARGAAVWRSGEWSGCAGGQLRDRDLF